MENLQKEVLQENKEEKEELKSFYRETMKDENTIEVAYIQEKDKSQYVAELEQMIIDDDMEIARRTAHKQEIQGKLALLSK